MKIWPWLATAVSTPTMSRKERLERKFVTFELEEQKAGRRHSGFLRSRDRSLDEARRSGGGAGRHRAPAPFVQSGRGGARWMAAALVALAVLPAAAQAQTVSTEDSNAIRTRVGKAYLVFTVTLTRTAQSEAVQVNYRTLNQGTAGRAAIRLPSHPQDADDCYLADYPDERADHGVEQSPAGEYVHTSGTLTFPAGSTGATMDIEVRVCGSPSTLLDGEYTFGLELFNLRVGNALTIRSIRTVTGTIPGTIGAPSGLSATNDGSTQVELSWTAPSDNGGSEFTGYRIEYSAPDYLFPGDEEWGVLEANTGSTTTNWDHNHEFAPGTNLRYRVSAINDAGPGPASSVAEVTTAASALDTTPPIRTGTTVNHRTITITFNEALDESSVPNPTQFEIKINNGRATRPNSVDVSGDTVTLALGEDDAVSSGDAVLVGYRPPVVQIGDALVPVAKRALKDPAGNLAEQWKTSEGATMNETVAPELVLSPTELGVREGDRASYLASLSGRPSATVTVTVTVAPGVPEDDRVTVSRETLTFTRKNWNVPQAVTVAASQNAIQDADNSATLAHVLTGMNYEENGATGPSVQVTVIDDDKPSESIALRVSPETVSEGPPGTATTTLMVTAMLDGIPEQTDTTVTLSLEPGTAVAGTHYEPADPVEVNLTIPAGQKEGTTELELGVIGDDIDEGDERWTVRIDATFTPKPSPSVLADLTARDGSPLTTSPLTVAIVDDDERGLALPPEPLRIDREGVATWTVALSSQPAGGGAVTVSVSPVPEWPGVAVSPASLTFTESDWNDQQPVTVRVDPPDRYRNDETVTFTLTASGPGSDYHEAGVTGEVEVSLTNRAAPDGMVLGWLVRYVRTVAGQVVDAVRGRLDGGDGSHVTVGGERLGASGQAALARAGEASGDAPASVGDSLRTPTEREVLLGSSFHLESGGGESGGRTFAAWGRVTAGRFDADAGDLAFDGDVTTGVIGADVSDGSWIAGAAVAFSEGEGGYRPAGPGASEFGEGTIESTLTSVLPYARLELGDGLSAWGLVGFGTGELTLTEGRGASPHRYRTDIGMRLGALGGRKTLATAPDNGGFELALGSDLLWTRATSDAAGELEGGTADASRLRLLVDASRIFEVGEGATLAPNLEVGIRHDGGDAETGAGLEAGAGVRYARNGVTVEGSVRGLLAHAESGYEEWGASASMRIDPRASGRGLSLTVAPAFGAGSGGAERLWSLTDASRFTRGKGEFVGKHRLYAEVGYGLGGPRRLGVMTPYAGLGLAGEGERSLRVGARWKLAPDVTLGLEGTQRERTGARPEQGLTLRGAVRW